MKLKDYIIFFLMGVINFSRFSGIILYSVFGIEIFLPELLFIFFIPYFYFYHKNYLLTFLNKNAKGVLAISFILLLLISWSYYFNEDGSRYILNTARSYFIIFVFFLVGKTINNLKVDALFMIALGSLISSFFTINLIETVEYEDVYYLSLTLIFFLIIIPVIKRRYYILAAILPLIIYIAIISAFRRAFVVIILSLVLGFLINIIKDKNYKIIYSLLFLSGIIVISQKVFEWMVRIASMNEYLYSRIVMKTMQTYDGTGAKGDVKRIEYISDIKELFFDNLYPHGFITRVPDISGSGLFMDLPLYELFYTFGSVITLLLIYSIIRQTFTFTWLHFKKSSSLFLIVPSTILLFFTFLFFDGGFLIWTYNTIFTGLFLGILYNNKIVIS